MKKILFGLALISWMTSCTTSSYKITGTFEDGVSGTAYLKKIEMQGLKDIDSAEVTEGKFSFEGSVEYPELHLIFFGEEQIPAAFFLENANITIAGNSTNLDKATIKGSKSTDLFDKFNKEVPHQEKVNTMREEFFVAQQNGDQTTMESLIADMQSIIEEQETYYRNFLKSNNNAVGAFLTLNMAQALSYEELEEISTSLEKELKDHPYVAQLKLIIEPMKMQAQAEANLAVGNVAPNFTLTDINGNEVSLESFRGKYVFLDFWAGWCQPCRIENPNLVEAYKQFGGDNFEIISVSLDRTEEDWRKAVEEDGLTWTLLYDQDGLVANSYAVQSIPNTFLLDKEGVIIEKQLRGEAITKKLESLLN